MDRYLANEKSFYYFVSSYGTIGKSTHNKKTFVGDDEKRWEVGNYFQTEEEAKESKFYKVFKD